MELCFQLHLSLQLPPLVLSLCKREASLGSSLVVQWLDSALSLWVLGSIPAWEIRSHMLGSAAPPPPPPKIGQPRSSVSRLLTLWCLPLKKKKLSLVKFQSLRQIKEQLGMALGNLDRSAWEPLPKPRAKCPSGPGKPKETLVPGAWTEPRKLGLGPGWASWLELHCWLRLRSFSFFPFTFAPTFPVLLFLLPWAPGGRFSLWSLKAATKSSSRKIVQPHREDPPAFSQAIHSGGPYYLENSRHGAHHGWVGRGCPKQTTVSWIYHLLYLRYSVTVAGRNVFWCPGSLKPNNRFEMA